MPPARGGAQSTQNVASFPTRLGIRLKIRKNNWTNSLQASLYLEYAWRQQKVGRLYGFASGSDNCCRTDKEKGGGRVGGITLTYFLGKAVLDLLAHNLPMLWQVVMLTA